MYGVRSRIGKLQLAIGQRVCISETRKPGDCLTAFRTAVLKVITARMVENPTVTDTKNSAVL